VTRSLRSRRHSLLTAVFLLLGLSFATAAFTADVEVKEPDAARPASRAAQTPPAEDAGFQTDPAFEMYRRLEDPNKPPKLFGRSGSPLGLEATATPAPSPEIPMPSPPPNVPAPPRPPLAVAPPAGTPSAGTPPARPGAKGFTEVAGAGEAPTQGAASATTAAAAAEAAKSGKPIVAVLDFSSDSLSPYALAILTQKMIAEVQAAGSAETIGYAGSRRALSEQGLLVTDPYLAPPANRDYAKALNADFIILGNVGKIGKKLSMDAALYSRKRDAVVASETIVSQSVDPSDLLEALAPIAARFERAWTGRNGAPITAAERLLSQAPAPPAPAALPGKGEPQPGPGKETLQARAAAERSPSEAKAPPAKAKAKKAAKAARKAEPTASAPLPAPSPAPAAGALAGPTGPTGLTGPTGVPAPASVSAPAGAPEPIAAAIAPVPTPAPAGAPAPVASAASTVSAAPSAPAAPVGPAAQLSAAETTKPIAARGEPPIDGTDEDLFAEAKNLAIDHPRRYLILKKLAERNPKNLLYLRYLCHASYCQDKMEETLQNCDGVLRPEPTDSAILTIKGMAYYNLDKYQEAVNVLRRALMYDPNNVQAQFNLAFTYQVVDPARAKEEHRKYLKMTEGMKDQEEWRKQSLEYLGFTEGEGEKKP